MTVFPGVGRAAFLPREATDGPLGLFFLGDVHPLFLPAASGKRELTPVNKSQREMPFLAPVKAPANAPDALVRRVETDEQAVAVSITASGLKQSYIAAAMGRSAPWLSRIRHGSLQLTDAQAIRFCAVTGANLLLQVRALREALAEIRGELDAAETIRRYAAELRRAA